MDLQITDQPAPQVQADALIVGIYHDSLTDAAQQLDLASGGVIRRVLELGEFKPDIGKSLTLYCLDNVATPVVVLIGLGEKSAFTRNHAFRAMATASRQVCDRQREHLVYCGDSHWSDSIAADGVAGAIVGMAGPDLHQTKRRRFAPGRTSWAGIPAAAVGRGRTLGESINLTRRLVNEPPNLLYPESFAEAASQVAANLGLSLEVWDQQRLEAERCGALLAVAQGSARSPRVVILQHGGASREDAPWLALVGKGVTFDSGGLSLKPSDSMKTMKCDMAGAATVLGAMQAIAKLKLPVNVMGLMGLVENLPSATAFKLGDVITARSGTTIEIHNTDAEGRLVLADLLDVAVERGADRIVDLATLTGACVVALGTDVAGAMTNHQSWCDTIMSSAERCGEQVWQLPMFSEYGEQIKGTVGDIKNVGSGRWGGAITAAKFLEAFVRDIPWTHLDIAGPAFVEKSKAWLDEGGSGVMVRSLVQLAETWDTNG